MVDLSQFLSHLHSYFLSNFFDVIGFVLAAVGGFFGLLQWHSSVRNSRAENVKELLRSIMNDSEIQKFQNLTDYGKEWYTGKFHSHEVNEIAKIADRTLFTYNYICYLYDTRVINKSELKIFNYYMIALAQNKDLLFYMLDLYQYSVHKKGEMPMFPFGHYLKFCIKNKCISKNVKNRNFFYYYLCDESIRNGNGYAHNIPSDIVELIRKTNGHLFIESVSRCEHCCHYSENKCKKGCNKEDHFWAGKDKACGKFELQDSSPF